MSSRGPDAGEQIRGQDFDFIRDMTRRHSAISLDESKQYLVHSRLLPLARRDGFASVTAFITSLRAQPFGAPHVEAVEAIATTETSFFRDLHPFDALREEIIPELMRSRAAVRTITFWSAGCSSGQEPYSVALLVKEHFPSLISGWRVDILASDLADRVLARARQGVYQQHEVNRGLPARILVRYFQQQGMSWQLRPDITSMVKFFQHNLIGDWSAIPKVDVLFLRNILIYFDVETRKQILGKVRKVLRPDGLLLLGTAETALNLDESFGRVRVGRAVFYKLDRGGGR